MQMLPLVRFARKLFFVARGVDQVGADGVPYVVGRLCEIGCAVRPFLFRFASMGWTPYPRQTRVINLANKVVSFGPNRCNKGRNNDLLAHIASVQAGHGAGLSPCHQVETAACTWQVALHLYLRPVVRNLS